MRTQAGLEAGKWQLPQAGSITLLPFQVWVGLPYYPVSHPLGRSIACRDMLSSLQAPVQEQHSFSLLLTFAGMSRVGRCIRLLGLPSPGTTIRVV